MAPKKRSRPRKRQSNSNPDVGNKKQKQETPSQTDDPILFGSDSDDKPSPPPSSDLDSLLDPYSKDQLISFLCDAAVADASLLARIQSLADRDVSHRKVFVHGLSWDTTRDDLVGTFSSFGPIEECNVVLDKITGRTKGYGFVLFQARAGATKALKQPQKKIKNRVASCQLASIGPTGSSAGTSDTAGRKIYVSNVHADADREKLREFFARFGEIETGPLGYDMVTGKSRGFALFVYKTVEGAAKALEEPYKMFEGHQLHCQKASGSKGKSLAGVTGPVTIPVPQLPVSGSAGILGSAASQPVLAAVAAAQNLALMSQNPAYSALLGQNPFLAAALSQTAFNQAAINPAAMALNPAALNSIGVAGLGGYGGNTSLPGSYETQGTTGMQGMPYGQSSLAGLKGPYGGFPPYF